MPRPAFAPDPDQRRILGALSRNATRRAEADTHFTQLVEQADAAGIPILLIADRAQVQRKTIYARLGRSPVTRSTEGDHEQQRSDSAT